MVPKRIPASSSEDLLPRQTHGREQFGFNGINWHHLLKDFNISPTLPSYSDFWKGGVAEHGSLDIALIL